MGVMMKPIHFTEINGRKFLGFNAIAVPQFYPPRKVVVVKVSKLWIMVRCNELCTMKYSRKDGWKPVKRKKQTA